MFEYYNMRVALCLSGLLTNYEHTIESIYSFSKCFQKCDIFLAVDKSEQEADVHKVKSILQPQHIIFVDSKHKCNNLNMWHNKKSYISDSETICYRQ